MSEMWKRLTGAAALMVITASGAPVVGAGAALAQTGEPNTDDGRAIWMLNVNFAQPWSHEYAFTNMFAYMDGEITPVRESEDVSAQSMAAAGLFDPETGWIKALPDSAPSGIRLGLVRSAKKEGSAAYLRGKYILEWDGDADLSLGWRPGKIERVSENKIIEDFRRTSGNTAIVADKVGAGGFGNVRFYRAEHEAAIKAGERFTPEFIKLVNRYKVVRTLDWTPVNNSFVNRADKLKPADSFFWGGEVPIDAQFDLAVKADTALWLPLPAMIGAPDETVEAAASLDGHWKVKQEKRLEIYGAVFEDVLASDEWDKLSRRLVAAMDKSGYPKNRMFYLELGNEPWGHHFLNGGYFWAFASELKEKTGAKRYPGKPMMAPYGYVSARFAESFAKALDEAGRGDQAWTMVLNSHQVWADQARGALMGAADYKGGAYTQPMSRYGVAITGYYHGGFRWKKDNTLFGRRMSRDAWVEEWARRLKADPEGLAQLIEDYLTQDAPATFNISKVIEMSNKHAAIAEEFGAKFIGQYEGGNHDNIERKLKKVPGAMDFSASWLRSEHRARVLRDHATRMHAAFPDAILANYHHYGAGLSPEKPWDTALIWEQGLPPERALFEQLRGGGNNNP